MCKMYPGNKRKWPKLKRNKGTSGNKDQVKSSLSIRFLTINLKKTLQNSRKQANFLKGIEKHVRCTPLNDPPQSRAMQPNSWNVSSFSPPSSFLLFLLLLLLLLLLQLSLLTTEGAVASWCNPDYSW